MTEASEWRFVPGRLNPSDTATSSAVFDDAIPPGWLDGPAFLQEPEEDLPKDLPWIAINDELRAVRSHHLATDSFRPFSWKDVQIKKDDIQALSRLEGYFFELI